MKACCGQKNEFSRYQDREVDCIKFFTNLKTNLLILSNSIDYEPINAKFKALCLKMNSFEPYDVESESLNAIRKEPKIGVIKFCSQINSNMKKDIKNFINKIPKTIKEKSKKLFKIPKVLRNSISERKKKFSLSKSKIKRKSVVLIKALFNEVNSKQDIPRQFHEKNTIQLNKFGECLHNLALKASELSNNNDYTDSKTKKEHTVFKNPSILTSVWCADQEDTKYETCDSLFQTVQKTNSLSRLSSSYNATFKTVDTTFNRTDFAPLNSQTHKAHFSTVIQDSCMTDDESDTDSNSGKPIPNWAKSSNILRKASSQSVGKVNFSKLFKSAFVTEINLEEVFQSKKNFHQRSSSADWQSIIKENNAEMSYMLDRV